MNITLDCIPCTVNSFLRLLKSGSIPESAKEPAMRHLLKYLADVNYDQSPPDMAREMHRMIRGVLKSDDPYREIKARHNQKMMDHHKELRAMIDESDDPFNMAMRLAMAGNVIDFGAQEQMDIMETIDRVVHSKLAIDHSEKLRRDLDHAETVLYIGDNCGEIVLDELFVETLAHPNLYFAVRGAPVINDATLKDARMIGLDQKAHLITTGDDAPGAVWETVSDEFKDIFNKADVIISKGQGNLEGLLDIQAPIYFILVVKCDVIAKRLGAPKGGFVVKYTDLD